MDESGVLSLKWNNHKSTFAQVLAIIRQQDLYTDATLACEGEFFPVHKLVLSTCSDYFSDVFQSTPCRSPVVILKDINVQDLRYLLDYMYIGEVEVEQMELPSLMRVAECLKIKGLITPGESPDFNGCHLGTSYEPSLKKSRTEDTPNLSQSKKRKRPNRNNLADPSGANCSSNKSRIKNKRSFPVEMIKMEPEVETEISPENDSEYKNIETKEEPNTFCDVFESFWGNFQPNEDVTNELEGLPGPSGIIKDDEKKHSLTFEGSSSPVPIPRPVELLTLHHGQQPRNYIILDNHIYQISRKTFTVAYLTCFLKRKKGEDSNCPATATIDIRALDDDFSGLTNFTLGLQHNHVASSREVLNLRFRKKCMIRARQTEEPLINIYQSELQNEPLVTISFAQMKRSMGPLRKITSVFDNSVKAGKGELISSDDVVNEEELQET